MSARFPVLWVAALAVSCGYKPAVEYDAAKQPPYQFPHSTHVDADVKCTSCHGDIEKATSLDPAVRHIRLPASPSKNAACSDCHDTDPKLPAAKRAREFRLRFDHSAHLKRVSDCRACHRQLTEPGDKVARTPPMDACTSCHVHQRDFAEARCTPCHVDLKGYKPETAFRHEGNWIAAHANLARPSAESCAACHDQTFCTSCHSSATAPTRLENIFPERVDRSFIHRGDYVSRHMIDARANPASCRRCHGSGFCDACHTANALTSAFPGTLRDPHPPGWSNNVVGDGGAHKFAARRDITSCAGCHDQGAQANCNACHNRGPRVNPHPRKFLSTHTLEDARETAMCRTCHG